MSPGDTVSKDSTLHIGIVIIGLRSDGGAEALVHTMLGELAESHHRVTIVTLKPVRPADRSAAETTGARVVALPARFLWSPLRFVRVLRALRGVDVIHTHLVGANILGILAARLLRVPCVTTLHNAHTRGDAHWYHGRLESWLLRRGDVRILAVGADTAEARRSLVGDRPIHVLDNAVGAPPVISPERRESLRAEVMTDPTAAMVISVGRLEPQKAQHELIEAVRQLRDGGHAVELVIAGRGRLETDLREAVDEQDLAPFVHLVGTRRDARDLMAVADLFALSSHWEGLPVSLLEAMIGATPVVVTDVGDIGRVVDETTGYLVEPGDPAALADAIGAVIDDPTEAERRATAGAARVATDYGAERWVAATIAHHRAAISDSGGQTATASTGSDQTI